MCIPYDKTFHLLPYYVTLWTWPWSLTYFWKTLTLAITFKPEVIGLSYCTCVFLVTWPFTWYHNIGPCNLDLEVWPTFEKLTLAITFKPEVIGFHIAQLYSLWHGLSHGTIIFGLVTLTLKFDPLVKNFNLGCYLMMVAAQLCFVGEICIPRNEKLPAWEPWVEVPHILMWQLQTTTNKLTTFMNSCMWTPKKYQIL